MIASLDTNELERFRDLIARYLGLQFDDTKFGFLAEVLRRRMDAGRQTPAAYLTQLENTRVQDDLKALAEELTVGETYFFRHVEQYRAFVEVALPDRLRDAPTRGTGVQILSAGCASGEEPYSLAIAVQNAPVDRSHVAILGVDVNAAAIERARRGRFSPWVLRDTAPDIQRRWFRSEGREFVLAEDVRNPVRFGVCNLVDPSLDLWRAESLDIVFCRNVLMYLTPSAAAALVGRFAGALRPGGYLFLGHAETLRGLSSDFHLRHTHGTFYYQRRDEIGHYAARTARVDAFAPIVTWRPAASLDLVNTSWVDTIRRASERIEALVSEPDQLRPPGRSQNRRPSRASEIGLVLELLREERFAEALALMDELPTEAAGNAELLLLRAVLLTHGGQLVDAEEVCNQLLSVDELNAGAHYLLALCREGAGDQAGALSHDQVAVYLDPGFAMAHLHMGVLSRRLEDRVTARRELEQASLLLQREDPSRLLLFGGGFSREALIALCRAELVRGEGRS